MTKVCHGERERYKDQGLSAPGCHRSFAWSRPPQDSAPIFGGSSGTSQVGMGDAGTNPQPVMVGCPGKVDRNPKASG